MVKDISNLIKKEFNNFELNLSDEQVEKFNIYYNYLIEENEKFNLTAIIAPEDVVLKHFIDSCLGNKFIADNSTVCDIGTGAGFPAIPLKILNPTLKITMVDSLNKRVNFLNSVINILGLENIVALHNRAEEFLIKKEYRETFDFVVSRAVASTNTLLELTIPALKIGGRAIFYKSNSISEELVHIDNACKILGCKSLKTVEQNLGDNFRTFAVFEKIYQTPAKYPRGKNLPKSKPL